MLDDAGIILDDGTVARLGEDRFLVSTTTGNLDAVEQWFGWWLAGGPRDVGVTNVTSQLAAVNLAGPRAREILARVTDLDVSREAMPYLAAAEGAVAGVPAVLLRIGFVGELGFEIHVPADYGAHLWDALHGRRARPSACDRSASKPSACCGWRRVTRSWARTRTPCRSRSTPAWAGSSRPTRTDFIGRDGDLDDAPAGGQMLTGFEVLGHDVPGRGRRHRARRRPPSGA